MSSAIDSLLLFRSEKTEGVGCDPSPSQWPTCAEHDGGGDANAPTASENPEAPQGGLAALHNTCRAIEARLVRFEDDLHVLEKAVMSLDSRLLRAEELLQSMATPVTDKSRPQRLPRTWRREDW